MHKNPRTLSGGQQKLLNLGMVLMADPAVVLLDEPVTGVNPTLANKNLRMLWMKRRAGHFLWWSIISIC